MPKLKPLSKDELDDLREYCAHRWEEYPQDVAIDRKVIRDNFLRLLATVAAHAEEIRKAKEEGVDAAVEALMGVIKTSGIAVRCGPQNLAHAMQQFALEIVRAPSTHPQGEEQHQSVLVIMSDPDFIDAGSADPIFKSPSTPNTQHHEA